MYDFYKTPGVPGGPKQFSEVVEVSECLKSLPIFLCDLYKTPEVPEGSKHFAEVLEAPEYFCMASTRLQESLKVLIIF